MGNFEGFDNGSEKIERILEISGFTRVSGRKDTNTPKSIGTTVWTRVEKLVKLTEVIEVMVTNE